MLIAANMVAVVSRRNSMRHSIMIAFPLAGLTLISAAGASVAHAETTTCAGRIWAVTLDNIVIQDGIACTSQGTCPQRTIYVMTRARAGRWSAGEWRRHGQRQYARGQRRATRRGDGRRYGTG